MKYQVKDIDETKIQEKYHTSTLVSKLLTHADFNDAQIVELLSPELHIHKSEAKCIKDACKRILEAKEKHEKIFIGGDYDADGICATTILKDTLDRLQIENGYYIPDRFQEGYGLHAHTVEQAHEKGYQLVITVDNGVKAFEAIQKAKELGMDIIVTDHHQIEEEIPSDLVVHPDYLEEEFAYLSGAGVALMLALHLVGEVKEHIALAAIAMIADVMPLWRQTRTIVQRGLDELKHDTLPAVQALIPRGSTIDEKTIAFQVVPKINSVGRMDDDSNVNTLVTYLLLKNEEAIERYAEQLEKVNNLRKALSLEMSQKALKQVSDEKILFIYDPSFHEGLCGLVAGRIAEETKKPVIVLTQKDDLVCGSGRSVPGLNLFELCQDYDKFVSFGGHEQAIGLRFLKDDYDDFKESIYQKLENIDYQSEEALVDVIRIDASELSFDSINDLNLLKPFPKKIQNSLFALYEPEILRIREYPKITKYMIRGETETIEGIVFAYRKLEELEQPHLLIGTPSINRYQDQISVQFDIVEMA